MERKMKKLIIALGVATALSGAVAVTVPTFAEQSSEGQDNADARRILHLEMMDMMDTALLQMKTNGERVSKLRERLKVVMDCEEQQDRGSSRHC
jgi:Na+-translocating ferredoxin:NAD+ oxidoreductase RnfG subunit